MTDRRRPTPNTAPGLPVCRDGRGGGETPPGGGRASAAHRHLVILYLLWLLCYELPWEDLLRGLA